MPAQKFTAISHLLGGVCLLIAWRQTEFWPLWTAIFFYAVLYMPTIALTNAIAFHHMGDSKKFGNIRVWGTLGWIASTGCSACICVIGRDGRPAFPTSATPCWWRAFFRS
jgi:hypothetical protein